MMDLRLRVSLAAGHRQHVDAEGVLEAGLLVKHVNEVVHVGVFGVQERCGCPPWRTGWKYPRYPS